MTTFHFGPFSFYRDHAVTLAFLSLPFGGRLGLAHQKTRVWSSALNGLVNRPLIVGNCARFRFVAWRNRKGE